MKAPYLQITVDGPSGVGKGTISKLLAKKYALKYLDSGTIYRAFAYRLMSLDIEVEKNFNPSKSDLGLLSFKNNWYDFKNTPTDDYIVTIGGEDVTDLLRTEKIGQLASIVSANADIRNLANVFQRAFLTLPANSGYQGAILDGRDSGREILPHAPFKFYLDCSMEVKANRRCKQTGEKYEDIMQSFYERDMREKERNVAPLKPADGAHEIDTSNLTIDEVFTKVCSIINA